MLRSYFLDLFHKDSIFNLNDKKKMSYKLENIVIANLKEKFFVWTPPKTASTTASIILPDLGFRVYKNEGIHLSPSTNFTYIHNHFANFFHGHENYSFITTLRNPYTLFISKYKSSLSGKESTSEDFTKFLEMYLYGIESEFKHLDCYNYSVRTPDYIIRAENMFEDYIKIPFILGSDFYKSGKLLENCGVKNNKSTTKISDWKSLYNQNSADMIYYTFSHVFELGGYDRNSWK
jgi:hypothetical protein